MAHKINVDFQEISARRDLLAQWSRFENARPPVIVFLDSPFYCKLADIPIEQIYRQPEAMVQAQLLGWKKVLEAVDCDNPGPFVGIDFGSCFTGSIYGCELIEQPGSVPTTHPWFQSETDLNRLRKIDPFAGEFQNKANDYYTWMKLHSKQYPVCMDGGEDFYPLDTVELMTGSEGPFSILCMIAGLEHISMWCYEKPDLVMQMMEIVTAKEIQRIQMTYAFMGKPEAGVFLADDYSPYMPLQIYLELIFPFQKRLCGAFDKRPCFHSCIPDKRLLKYWKEDLEIGLFNGFKPQNGLENLKRDYKPVADSMSGKVLLEPDLDGANLMIADDATLKKSVEDFMQVFPDTSGLKLCFTLSGGHNTQEIEKCNVIKDTVTFLSKKI